LRWRERREGKGGEREEKEKGDDGRRWPSASAGEGFGRLQTPLGLLPREMLKWPVGREEEYLDALLLGRHILQESGKRGSGNGRPTIHQDQPLSKEGEHVLIARCVRRGSFPPPFNNI
jgi:hypothetical protein